MEDGEIVGIGSGGGGRVGRAVGYKEIEKDGGDDCTLGDSKVDFAGAGRGMVVGAGCHAAAEVGG